MSGVIRLITLRKQQEERLEYLANFDDLTGHFNKVRLRDALEHALAQSQRFGQTGVYVVIGVDHLDRINTGRSEEHTSELQSLMRISYDVFCLKKKKQSNIIHMTNTTNYEQQNNRTITHN